MSRFDAPPDSLEAEDFSIPSLSVPPRRHARPNTEGAPKNSNRGASGARPKTARAVTPQEPPRRPKTKTPDFDPDFDDAFAASAPRRGTTKKATETSTVPGIARHTKRGERPKSAPNSSQRPTNSGFAPRLPAWSALHFEILGVILIALGAILAFYATQKSVDGALPAYALRGLRALFGVGAIAIPLALLFTGLQLFLGQKKARVGRFWCGFSLALGVFLTFKHLQIPRGTEFLDAAQITSHGGYLGGASAFVLRRTLGEIGALIALGALSLVAVMTFAGGSLGSVAAKGWESVREFFAEFWADLRGEVRVKRALKDREKSVKRAERQEMREMRALEREQEIAQIEATPDDEWDENPWEEQLETRPRRSLSEIRAKNGTQKPVATPAPRGKSPFFRVDDWLDEEESSAPHASTTWENPCTAAPAVDPNSTLEAPNFLPAYGDALPAPLLPVEEVNLPAPDASAQTPIEKTPVENAASEKPEKVAPRVEIVDAPPPPSVVAPLPDIDIQKVVAGENADEILTPQEELERQALESALESDEIAAPKPKAPELPRRSFGDGPLMPEYFDDAVRALDPPIPVDNTGAQEEIEKAVLGVQETLGSFKIDARVTDVKRGPVITRYEVQPGPGVRVATIANLDKDLARSLSALAVRIEAPVPGKNVVGIEIPNKKVHLVRMRDVLEQPEFLAHQSKIAFVLGKDIAGQPKWADLAKMPHMLIAGATNSGKSVCLNTIIASLLVRARPDEVRLSLIDPKRVELTLYRGIRHLMHDVVVEPKQAVVALRRAIEEMDRRYKLFAQHQVRNIASFNAKMEATGQRKLPFIVIVIDELADLMMTAAAEFEKLICRLAQLARATGIHLIVATQRPSVNVITGVIKANIPARVAFAVASQVDSRTILDAVGAERLIGMGDMLFDSNNGGKAVRIQGAFLSEEECNRIVEVVKATYQYEEHDDEFADLPTFDLYSPDDEDTDFEAESFDKKEEKRDSLYDEIVEFVLRHQEMSASNIQRKFGIGYPRAGRIVDQLERAGVLGPADGPKPRKVLGRPMAPEIELMTGGPNGEQI